MVVPQLITRSRIHWQFKGEATARQCALYRGLHPRLADPKQSESSIFGASATEAPEAMLAAALEQAKSIGLCSAGDSVVAMQRVENRAIVKTVAC